ncbi:hypothetical protein AAVH_31549 [Aphelenchoides avenae]|nr:hypothetical protein AAVH_31549 [Aphelenchus avenae]
MEKFMPRHLLALRKPMTVSQKTPIDYDDRIVGYRWQQRDAERVLQARTEAANLAELMASFKTDLDKDDVGNVSDAQIVDDPREEGNNNAETDCLGGGDF